MKECDKQYNKTVRNPANFSLDRRSYYTGWRAALEWLRNMVIHESDGPSNPKDLMDCINKELGDT